jgi:hypothetical protein
MSSSPSGLTRSAIDLLLASLEGKSPLYSAAALRSYPAESASLLSAGLIKPAGHEPLTTADTDRPVALQWSPEAQSHGYFSETDGWVAVHASEISMFAIDIEAIVTAITAGLDIKRNPSLTMVHDHLWEIGLVRLTSQPARIPVFFGRRLFEPSVWAAGENALAARSSARRPVLLTSTGQERLPKAFLRCCLVSIGPMLGTSGSLAIDGAAVALRYQDRPLTNESQELTVVADGKEVRFRGEVFRFPRGVHQRRIICQLHEHYLAGQFMVSSQALLEELQLHSTKRVRDIFKGSRAWGRLLTEKFGMCGFCLNEPTQ